MLSHTTNVARQIGLTVTLMAVAVGMAPMAGWAQTSGKPFPGLSNQVTLDDRVLPAPIACDQRKAHNVAWSPLPSATITPTVRDDLWSESNVHGYLGACDTITLLPGLDQIQATMDDPSHEDQLRCLWDLGLMKQAQEHPAVDPKSGMPIVLTNGVRRAVLQSCSAAAIAHHDGYLNDQVKGLVQTLSIGR